jgi:hypothetical protein
MRCFVLCFSVWLFSSTPLFAQVNSEDPYDLDFVRANLRTTSITMPAITKNFQRLGDAISVALIKIFDEKDLRDAKTVNGFLPLIRESFSYPSIISLDVNKKPRVTMLLLDYLKQNIADAQSKRDIQMTIDYVHRQTSSTSP